MPTRSKNRARDLSEFLRLHAARGYYLKRNAVALLLVFVWATTLAGVYSFDLWLLTPAMVGAISAWAIVRSQYRRFRDKRNYFLTVALVDNLAITVTIYLLGGAGSAAVFTFYTYPIVYHSLTRQRAQIYLVANMAAVMYAVMITLEHLGVLPYRNVMGFAQPPPITYLGLVVGAFLMLNLAALVGDAVTQAFAKLWDVRTSLDQSQRKLQQLTAKTELTASSISHELENPLSAVANAADLLIAKADTTKAEDLREVGQTLHRNVTNAYKMLTLFRQSLAALKKDEPVQAVALDEVVHDVVEDMDTEGRLRAVEIRVPSNLPSVLGQWHTLGLLLRSLFQNALEHEVNAQRQVVCLESLGPDSVPGFLRFAVTDNGPGFPEDDRRHMFEPFVTLGQPVSEGRGLGIALAKRVVEQAGGRIWTEDSDTGGARVVFTLPGADVDETVQ